MNHGDLIVVFEHAIPVILEDAADPAHSETMEFSRPQRAHTGAAEYRNAF